MSPFQFRLYFVLSLSVFALGCSKAAQKLAGLAGGAGIHSSVAVDPCAATGDGLTSGLTTITEEYNEGTGGAQYDATTEACWKTHKSGLSILQDSDFTGSFTTQSIGGVNQNSREISVAYRAGIQTNSTVNYSPHSTPDTGWDSGQWPYILDLYKNRQCFADVTVTAQLKPKTTVGGSEIYGVLLNSTITGEGSTRKMTGYLIHLNGGGASATLVKFENAYDHAFDFLDHFPGYNLPPLQPNPLIDGPYKGWDFKNTAWAAGGFPNQSAEVTVVARYQYDSATDTATIDWELRGSNGVDNSPGSFDKTRVLTGADALPPGGGYGVYTSLYGSLAAGTTNSVAVGKFQLDCLNP